MMLTGKCLEDFIKWNYDDDFGYIDIEPRSLVVHFENLYENLRNYIIIEFFESVKYTIDRNAYCTEMVITDWNTEEQKQYVINCDELEPLKEWYDEAIKKANEIYNEKHK